MTPKALTFDGYSAEMLEAALRFSPTMGAIEETELSEIEVLISDIVDRPKPDYWITKKPEVVVLAPYQIVEWLLSGDIGIIQRGTSFTAVFTDDFKKHFGKDKTSFLAQDPKDAFAILCEKWPLIYNKMLGSISDCLSTPTFSSGTVDPSRPDEERTAIVTRNTLYGSNAETGQFRIIPERRTESFAGGRLVSVNGVPVGQTTRLGSDLAQVDLAVKEELISIRDRINSLLEE